MIAPASSSTCSGERPDGLALLDGGLHALAREEAQLDDHVGDEARAGLLLVGRSEAVVLGTGVRAALGHGAQRRGRPLLRRSSRVRDYLDERGAVDVALDSWALPLRPMITIAGA